MTREKVRNISALFAFCMVVVVAMIGFGGAGAQTGKQAPGSAAALAFRNAAVDPPPGYTGPLFKLSRDFPTKDPGDCKECTWLSTDLKVNFKPSFPAKKMPSDAWTKGAYAEYIKRIIDYVKQGQDANLADSVGFQTKVNGKTRWFNVPWMAVDPTSGREFIHGTTNERTAHLPDLIGPQAATARGANLLPRTTPQCKAKFPYGFESWSVGYYNEWGGYSIGKVIPPSGRPADGSYLGTPMPAGLPFEQGTMVVKILTTSVPEECVPFLKGAPEWTVDRHAFDPQTGYSCERKPQTSRIVQIDVAVVDNRNENRWVYGTFVYDGDQKGATFWDRLAPLGLQWGSDPWTFPAVPNDASQPIQQTVLNPAVDIPEHYGCQDRLAGPVDNAQSSCISCHASAYAAPGGARVMMGSNVPPSFGFDGMCRVYSLDNASYFQNVAVPQAWPGGRYPNALNLDTSLQLEVAFTQYGLFNTKTPQKCTNPNQ